jgi:hypothetical protein
MEAYQIPLRVLFPYPLTSAIGCCLGSFVGCCIIGLPFGPLGLLIVLFGFPLGLLFAVPVNFVFLPLVCLHMPETRSKPVWILAVGCVGGFVSPALVALCERLIKYNPRLPLDAGSVMLAGSVGAIAGTVCAAYFRRTLYRDDKASDPPQA